MIPKVSICIPTYCQVDFLRQTLNSIVEQKYTDYEIIISDDSPNDSVKNLLLEFNFGKKLHYFSNNISLGSPENWNEAIRKANGEYIKILHHDDKLAHSNALGEFVRMLDNNPNADFGFSASRVEDIQSKSIREHRPTTKQLQMMSTMPEKLFLGNYIGAPSATIYRRKAAMDYDNRMKWLVDIDFYIRVLQRNKNFSYNPEILISTPTNAGHQVT
jgi:glycosyltransferase involved in cell wall biosynthesis